MNDQEHVTQRILVVDDEQAILDEFQQLLGPKQTIDHDEQDLEALKAKLFDKSNTSDHSVETFDLVLCHQGDEAVEKVRAAIEQDNPFAVAFLDMRMPPGPDGAWTVQQIRKIDPSVEIVVVTAYSDVDPADIGKGLEVNDKLLYIQKPCHPHEIRQFAHTLAAKWLAEKRLTAYAVGLAQANEQLVNEIDEHKHTQEKHRLLSQAITCTDDCVYIADLDGKIIFVNDAFCQTYGYDQDQVIGKNTNILWCETTPQHSEANDYRALTGWEVAFFHKRKDGSVFPVALSKANVNDENGNAVALVAIARDISERMKTEQTLRAEILRLKKQNRLKAELTTAAFDQLKRPLAALINVIQKANAGAFGQIGPQLRQNLQSVENKVEKASNIISELCDKSETNTQETKVQVHQT
ncbi:MAG: PAS domain-containing protein [Planctomycetota bacterium]|jgi:PAS domain S-box-containing protein